MRDLLIASAFLLLLVAGWFATSLGGNSNGRMPDAPYEVQPDHRDRDAYEAEIAKVDHDRLSTADEAEVAKLRAFVDEIGSGEFPSLAFDADPLSAPIPDGHRVAEAALFYDVTADWLSAFAWPASPAPPVPFSSVQVVEPDPFEAESFTRGWTREQLAAVLAQAKAGASR